MIEGTQLKPENANGWPKGVSMKFQSRAIHAIFTITLLVVLGLTYNEARAKQAINTDDPNLGSDRGDSTSTAASIVEDRTLARCTDMNTCPTNVVRNTASTQTCLTSDGKIIQCQQAAARSGQTNSQSSK